MEPAHPSAPQWSPLGLPKTLRRATLRGGTASRAQAFAWEAQEAAPCHQAASPGQIHGDTVDTRDYREILMDLQISIRSITKKHGDLQCFIVANSFRWFCGSTVSIDGLTGSFRVDLPLQILTARSKILQITALQKWIEGKLGRNLNIFVPRPSTDPIF